MKTITRTEQIDAKLLAQGQSWKLVHLLPDHNPKITGALREYVFQFRVVNANGYEQPILVSRNSFAIVPLLNPEIIEVRYYVEDGEEEPAEEQTSYFVDATIDVAKFMQP